MALEVDWGIDPRAYRYPSSRDETLARRLRRAERKRQHAAWLLLIPAVVFLIVALVLPIGSILFFGISNVSVRHTMPRTVAALANWTGNQLPGPEAFKAVVADLRAANKTRALSDSAQEINHRYPGASSLLVKSGREVATWPPNAGQTELIAFDSVWSDLELWRAIKSASTRLTPFYILTALDLCADWNGRVHWVAADHRIYLDYLGRTFWICFVVTSFCIILGYPLAFLIASATPGASRLLLTLTLLPFWTSILVRLAAWVIVLQQNGIVNSALTTMGVIEQPLALIYNRFGVYVAMIQVLIPFVVLPTYSVMRGIPKNLMQAAASLGARPIPAFLQVYLPLSLPGVAAGALMTYIIGLGYYLTPALIGGGNDQMESSLIARFALSDANWSMAAALAIVLLTSVGVVYFVFSRFMRFDALKLA